MATKKQHFEAPRLSDFDLEILPLAKKLVYVQKKALIVFGNALRIWGVTYDDFKKAPYDPSHYTQVPTSLNSLA